MGFFQPSGILNRKGFFGAKPFSPSDISGLSLWLDATTGLFDATSGGSAVTVDGSAVARWEDQSGNSRHITQATLGNRPILKTSIQNNKNIIRFDGSNDYLFRSDAFVISFGTHSIFVALKAASTTGITVVGEGNSTTTLPQAQLVASGVTNGSKLRTFYRNNSNLIDINQENYGTAYDSTFKIICLTDSGTLIKDYINNNNTASNSYSRGLYTLDRFTVGALLRATALNYFSGDIGEILIYNSVLSDSDRTKVQDYINSKWAIY